MFVQCNLTLVCNFSFSLLLISFTQLWQTQGHCSLSLHLCYLISPLISNNQLPDWSKPLMPLAGNCLCAHASQINQISQRWLNSVGPRPWRGQIPSSAKLLQHSADKSVWTAHKPCPCLCFCFVSESGF